MSAPQDAMKPARYAPGDTVRVRADYPPGHVRTPYFIRGHDGVVTSILGTFENPEVLAYGRYGQSAEVLYRVSFEQSKVWPDYDGPAKDTLVVDIYENWLEPRA